MSRIPIDAVIYDMGGVLLTWNPEDFARPYTSSEKDAQAVTRALFQAPQWALLDADAISEDTMLAIACASLPERLWDAAAESLAHYPEHQNVIGPTNELAIACHGRGLGTYLLSNAGVRFAVQGPMLPVWPHLDGHVVSAFEHLMKPDPSIYLLLCARYALDPARCLFVDDSELNCRGAEVAGLQAHHFTGDVEALASRLREGAVDVPEGH